MVKHWCLNGTMVDTENYSSPVPLIGLYTAAATLVCLLLIIFDMWAGFRRRRSWLPCRFFSLNSVTLTLISIASKLPVDLTSPMPSSQDQLSKLTGTVFICMSIGFLMPSLGILEESESQANLLALSIFVVTVVVNICIQIATGVISSFIVEHAIILFCMLTLTILLWVSSFVINDLKRSDTDRNKDLITKGVEESLLRRLQVCYLTGYYSSPQYRLCESLMCATISLICTICVVVLAEVMLRSLAFKELKFCKGISVYGWSMWIIVGTQVLTIAVITVAIVCRLLAFASDPKEYVPVKSHNHPFLQVFIPFYMRNAPKLLDLCFRFVYNFLVSPIVNLVIRAVKSGTQILGWLCHRTKSLWKQQDERPLEDFKQLLQTHDVKISEYLLRESVEEMERWTELHKRKSVPYLRELLESFPGDFSHQFDMNSTRRVSCLSLVLLVEMAKVSMPNSPTASVLKDVLDEMFEIIWFIDNKISVGNFRSKVKSMTAKVMRKGRTTNNVNHPKVVEKPIENMGEPQAELVHAIKVIGKYHSSFEVVVVRLEAQGIGTIITRRSYKSLNELSNLIKLLFVNMLRAFLAEFPKVILNHISDSPAEEFEGRARFGLKMICKFESVEPYLRWSFPVGSNITSLLNDPVSATLTLNVSIPVKDDGVTEVHQQDDNVSCWEF